MNGSTRAGTVGFGRIARRHFASLPRAYSVLFSAYVELQEKKDALAAR